MNSTNIKVMSEEIQHLKNEVHNLDVEIPAHPSTDVGKYLGVAADGSLAWSKVPDELPPTTGATAGQILALDNNKAPEWVNNYNFNYSETEINTGKKWIDGKDIYSIVYIGDFTEITETTNYIVGTLNSDCIISGDTILTIANGSTYINRYPISLSTNGQVGIFSTPVSFSLGSYVVVILYTKPTPSALTSSDPTREAEPEIIEEPEPETKSTRTKKSTK